MEEVDVADLLQCPLDDVPVNRVFEMTWGVDVGFLGMSVLCAVLIPAE
jgi:hypothetical protein